MPMAGTRSLIASRRRCEHTLVRTFTGDGRDPDWQLFAADHRHALNLDQDSRSCEARDGDERAARKALLEDVLADFSQAIAEPHVVDEHRHGDHVLQAGATDGLDGLVELRKN